MLVTRGHAVSVFASVCVTVYDTSNHHTEGNWESRALLIQVIRGLNQYSNTNHNE